MNKKLVINLLKYALAVSLLSYVIWSNWGQPHRVAKVVSDKASAAKQEDQAGAPTLTGKIVSYQEGQSVTIAPADQAPVRFDLGGKTKIALVDEDAELTEGMTVAVWESPRGLSFVWHHHILAHEEKIDVAVFMLALVICSIGVLLTLVRWWALVRAQDIPLSWSDGLRLGSVGYFFNTFLPGSVGGDIIKAAFIARERKDRRTTAVATVLLDRVIALWGLICFMTVLGAIFWMTGHLDQRPAQRIVIFAAGLVGVSLLGWCLMGLLPEWRAVKFAGRLARVPKLGHALAEVWNAVWMYRCRQRSVALALVMSWAAHVCFVLTYYCSALTLSSPAQMPSLAEHFLIVPIGLVIQAVPLFPGGAGIGELGFGGLYQLFGFVAATGVLMSLVQRVIGWIIGGMCYFVYLRMKPAIQATVQQEQANSTLPTPLPKPHVLQRAS